MRTDHIGRPSLATNDLGVKVCEVSYLPFGGVHTSTGGIDLRFPGQWFQSESGLHQNWMRDYDPTTGRYIQADPLGLVDGASVYGYALQNPGRYVDPRGEAIVNPYTIAVAGALAGYLFNKLADYVEDSNCGCAPLPNSDIASAAAGASIADGIGFVKKNFVTSGCFAQSSLQSTYLNKWFPRRLSRGVWAPTRMRPNAHATGIGHIAGRWLPLIAPVVGGYDAGRILVCLKKVVQD